MAIDVSYRDGFETTALDLSRLNKNLFKNSGVHINDTTGTVSTKLQVIEQTVPNMTVQVLEGESDFYGSDGETVYTFRLTATENVTITPATHTVGQTRIDIIILKVDASTKIATVEAVAGTPATTGSQVVPTTPSGAYKLAEISIVGGLTAITNSLITDRRNPISINTRNTLTGWNSLYQDTFVYNSTTSIKTNSAIDLTSILGRGDKIRMEQVTTGTTFWNIKNINYNSTVANRTYIEFEQSGVTNNVINIVEFSKNITPSGFNQFYLPYKSPEGQLIDGYIDVAVASNNLTVRVLHDTGVTPSTTRPVFINIGGTVRRITSALSVTANAGTNWFNSGSSELATKLIDYFVYLGYNATDGVTIGFSRIPSVNLYSQFSITNTNEKFCRISTITNASANDVYTVIGRFEATLSAGAGYTWTVPTFTADNLIQRPIYETRLMYSNPFLFGDGGTVGALNVSPNLCMYKIKNNEVTINTSLTIITKGSYTGSLYMKLPFNPNTYITENTFSGFICAIGANPVTTSKGLPSLNANNASCNFLSSVNTASVNWTTVANNDVIRISGTYLI